MFTFYSNLWIVYASMDLVRIEMARWCQKLRSVYVAFNLYKLLYFLMKLR